VTGSPAGDVVLRRAGDADLPAVVELLTETLGWQRDERHEALFRWKHRENPFGTSPAWAAFAGERLVALRVLMRWEFTWTPPPGGAVPSGRGGPVRPDPASRDASWDDAPPEGVVRAVRAVDTATAPEYQGQGLFRTLTLAAVDELAAEGVDLVFNTPNDQSRPGYLKMGWEVVGRLPVRLRPAGPLAAARLLRARVPAELWSEPTTAGEPVADVLADEAAVAELLATRPATPGLATRLDPGVLRWRYGTPLLGYRAVVARGGPARGLAIFRRRRRGPVREAAVGWLAVPGDDPRTHRRLRREVLAASGADVAVAIDAPTRAGWWPLPGLGPLLTARRLRRAPPSLPAWRLTLGDVELF
jgi:GNAT superfamily N-acetyltransferase